MEEDFLYTKEALLLMRIRAMQESLPLPPETVYCRVPMFIVLRKIRMDRSGSAAIKELAFFILRKIFLAAVILIASRSSSSRTDMFRFSWKQKPSFRLPWMTRIANGSEQQSPESS